MAASMELQATPHDLLRLLIWVPTQPLPAMAP